MEGLHERDLQIPPQRAAALLREAADAWGGSWQAESDSSSGELLLPVQAGLRHGRLQAAVDLEPLGEGCRMSVAVESVSYHIHGPALFLLTFAGVGSLAGVLWPFFPALGNLLPVTLVVTLAAWFLIVSRLQNRGLEEFLALVQSLAGEA